MLKNFEKVLKEYLNYDGYEVSEASNGAEAVEISEKEDFDLIIMDIMMPKLDGYSACKEIKKKKGKPFGEIFRNCARESLDDQNFTREEKEKIFSLGERLGYLGMDMQLRQLQLLEEDLENEIQELNKDLKEKKKLYQSLGILLGILLAVLVA